MFTLAFSVIVLCKANASGEVGVGFLGVKLQVKIHNGRSPEAAAEIPTAGVAHGRRGEENER
jgi:hypothetical protein